MLRCNTPCWFELQKIYFEILMKSERCSASEKVLVWDSNRAPVEAALIKKPEFLTSEHAEQFHDKVV